MRKAVLTGVAVAFAAAAALASAQAQDSGAKVDGRAVVLAGMHSKGHSAVRHRAIGTTGSAAGSVHGGPPGGASNAPGGGAPHGAGGTSGGANISQH